MRHVDQFRNRERAKRLHRAEAKRAKRLAVAREHAAGRKFRRALADKADPLLGRAVSGKRAVEGNAMLLAAGYARIFREPR